MRDFQYIARLSEPVYSLSADKFLNRINLFEKLAENWDGNGASTPNHQTLVNARKFIVESIAKEDILLENLEVDNITPTPYGTIVFDWEIDKNIVSVEIGDTEIGFFTDFTNSADNTISEDEFFNERKLPKNLMQAFRILFEGIYA